MTARFLQRVARVGWVGGIISFLLRHFSGKLPIKVLYEDVEMIALCHPAPSYQPHVLIVPRARVRTPFQLTEALFFAVLRAGEAVAGAYEAPLQLRINGGRRQEVMQAHFHLYPASGVREMRRADTLAEALHFARGAGQDALPADRGALFCGAAGRRGSRRRV